MRFRLTLWNTLVVLIASLLALFAVREAMRLTIESEVKTLIRAELTELQLAIIELHPDQSKINEEFERKILSHSSKGWFAALFDGNRTVWKSENFPEAASNTASTSTNPVFVFTRANERFFIRHQVTTADGSEFQVVLGEPVEFIRNDIWQLTKIMLLIGAGLLVVAPIGGYFLARHTTQPVREIIATTRSLNPAQLKSRLPIRGTGDELDQISIVINSFVEQIADYIRRQKEFVANAAHELRSPITAIQTSVEVTLHKERTVSDYQEQLETVSEQCLQLRHLVNQLLELAESDSTEIVSFKPVNLSNLIEKSINIFSGVAEEKEIEIISRIHADVEVQGDESKLRQVINNLLDNALKFSPGGGRVKVELSRKNDLVSLTVSDTGPGVPDEYLARIFERFFQVDQSRQRDARRGNGLGLSICKSIVELHGGTISGRNVTDGLEMSVQFRSSVVSKNVRD